MTLSARAGSVALAAGSSLMAADETLLQWIIQAKRGDAAAFECILRHFERLVLRTAQRMLGNSEDAKDAAQEVFLRLHKNLSKFSEEREMIPWLYRITVNICLDELRRKAPSGQEELELLDDRLNPEGELAERQRRDLLVAGLQELAPKEKAAIILRDLEGCSTAEVAKALGSTEATVRSQISTARIKLRNFVVSRTRSRS
jgi:RNA polymerase sigma-70 factor, ECF subfamily